jgi:hypothetical protein
MWMTLCDDDGKVFTESRKCRERDWSKLLSVETPVAFDISAVKSTVVGVRFRVGDRAEPLKVNEEIA